ncbi:MAG: hypothetical protein AAB359_04365 [Elusimicrobiota bacterium]
MKNLNAIDKFISAFGWLLLIAVLAVPSFLFYNWLGKRRQQNQSELAHELMASDVFPAEKSSRPPVARQTSPAPPRQAVKTEEPQAAVAPRPVAGVKDSPEQSPSAPFNPPAAAPAPAQEPEISIAAQRDAEVSTAPKTISYYRPKSARDPTFTPDDYHRIRKDQLQREEAERMQLLVESRVAKDPGSEVRISLQGIVGNAVIINGNMYFTGQIVRGVKILKIGADYIIGEYKGRKFRKTFK